MVKLNEANLDKLPHRVGRPAYDRSRLSAGIVAFRRRQFPPRPPGGLSRRAVQRRAGPRLGDRRRRRARRRRARCATSSGRQDWLTTVVEQEAERSTARVTGADDRHICRPARPRAIVAALADPAIRIVSLTVTEGGYFIDPATGVFDPEPSRDRGRRRATRDAPKTVFGLILAGLSGAGAATASRPSRSCPATTSRTTATSRRTPSSGSRDAARSASWRTGSRAEVAFPNGMVDRITPGDRPIASGRSWPSEFGIADSWPVFCEDVQAVGAGGPVPARPAGAREGRRHSSSPTWRRSS